jgi:NAD-dependent dihydropyrimidine dehydrogenase PreA subunit
VISERSNKTGYFPAQAANSECTGCAVCALVCPEVAIKVYRDIKIVAVEPAHKKKAGLTEEKV